MVLNNKIHFEILDDEFQPKKSIFSPNADLIKKAKVIDIGEKVEFVKKDDIIELYITTMFMIDRVQGFCSERDVIFTSGKPQPGKIHITNQLKGTMSHLNSAKVLSSNADDVEEGDLIHYRPGQSHILPDNSEIISETQVYYK